MKIPLFDLQVQHGRLRAEMIQAFSRVLDTQRFILGKRTLALPIFPEMTAEQQQAVAKTVCQLYLAETAPIAAEHVRRDPTLARTPRPRP